MSTENGSSSEGCCESSCCCRGLCPSAETWAILGLRLFLGLRLVMAGLMKFYGSDKALSFDHYYGGFVKNFTNAFASNTLLPNWVASPFLHSLGYLEIIFGAAILLGIKSKCSFAMSLLLYVSLAFGMMLMPPEVGSQTIGLIGVHIGLTVGALLLLKHNRFALWK